MTSLERPFNGGPWSRVSLDVKSIKPSERDFQVMFRFSDATTCGIGLRQTFDGDNVTTSVAMMRIDEEDGESTEEVIQSQTVDGSLDELTLDYRYGLLVVATSENDSPLIALIENDDAPVESIVMNSRHGQLTLNRLTIETSETPSGVEGDKEQLAIADEKIREGENQFDVGRIADSVRTFESVLKIYESELGKRHFKYASVAGDLAFLHSRMGQTARAETLHKECLAIRRAVLGERHPEYGTALNNFGWHYYSRGSYSKARSNYEEASRIFHAVFGERSSDYAISLNNLAELHRRTGDFKLAESLQRESLKIRKATSGEQSVPFARSLNNLAASYLEMGHFARAESLFRRSLEIEKSLLPPKHPKIASTLNNLAFLYKKMGDFDRAKAFYQEALKILDSDDPLYAMTLTNLADVCVDMGDLDQADRHMVQVIAKMEAGRGTNDPEYATRIASQAVLYSKLGNYVEALALQKQGYEVLKASFGKEHHRCAQSLNSLATLHQKMGDHEAAEVAYLDALQSRSTTLGDSHLDYAMTLNNLAYLYASIGDYERAEPKAVEAFNVSLTSTARSIPSLSEAQAREWLKSKPPRTDVLLTILRANEKFDAPAAYSAVWRSKLLVNRLQAGRQLPNDASPEASEVFGELRDARLKLTKLVSVKPSPAMAERYSQALANASERKEALERTLADLVPNSKHELAVRDASVEDLLKQLPPGVAVVDFVRVDNWRFVDHPIELTWDDGRKEQRLVKRGTETPVYDAFVLRRDRRPSPETPARWVPLGPAKPIETAVLEWRRTFASDTESPTTEDHDPSRRLRELIWDRLQPHLDGIDTVVLIPDAALHRVPWAALPGRSEGTYLIEEFAIATAPSGQQLFGALTRPAVRSESNLLLAGGIRYDQRDASHVPGKSESGSESLGWPFLDGAKAESQMLAKQWNDRGPLRWLQGVEADEASLARLMPKSRFVHLATHGFFDTQGDVLGVNLRQQPLYREGDTQATSVASRNPLLMTGIVLAGANLPVEKDEFELPIGVDGILTSEEISGLDLRNTELVTLSACETGLGDVLAGQGVFGLQRTLHGAGVRSTLTSLWKVDDRATIELMKQFYSRLWDDQISKVRALREAQLWMLKNPESLAARGIERTTRGPPRRLDRQKERRAPSEFARTHPYFWAAFQLSGDWR